MTVHKVETAVVALALHFHEKKVLFSGSILFSDDPEEEAFVWKKTIVGQARC